MGSAASESRPSGSRAVLALIADFTREIDLTSRDIDARAREDPYVEVLWQVRGVGRYIAMLVIAEVGAAQIYSGQDGALPAAVRADTDGQGGMQAECDLLT